MQNKLSEAMNTAPLPDSSERMEAVVAIAGGSQDRPPARRRKSTWLAAACCLVAIPAGVAVAEILDAENATPISTEERDRLFPPPKDGSNVIGSSLPSPQDVAECRKLLASGKSDYRTDLCEIKVAMAEGRLAPGEYSDAELQAALDRGE